MEIRVKRVKQNKVKRMSTTTVAAAAANKTYHGRSSGGVNFDGDCLRNWSTANFLKRRLRRWGSTGSWVGSLIFLE